ncbi:hypothetical protein ACVW8L_004530 [Vibrio parahaemolyticus]|nr:DUF3265 domain-containing protein [Vibrio parahaemolyticus]EJG0062282.1 DUF3265 domain-containing protein [Vibrio parahaemolyticus]EJG0454701.1 DUF3265 domain-containing protein [Vibrio parahaemolyticus]EJG0464114.1 DUF3265 domain-containing protein [Vibrio parahaemolyticus]EKN4680870.1 DUF3265 domain-containing protein [Vibrio parahaemolyticus]
MDNLASSLKSDGFNATLKNGKIVVKFDGLSNFVSISKDIAADEYKIKTNDTALSILASLFLLFGLYGINQTSGGNLLDLILVTFAILGLVTVILTELKVTKLRAVIDKLNRETSA